MLNNKCKRNIRYKVRC